MNRSVAPDDILSFIFRLIPALALIALGLRLLHLVTTAPTSLFASTEVMRSEPLRSRLQGLAAL